MSYELNKELFLITGLALSIFAAVVLLSSTVSFAYTSNTSATANVNVGNVIYISITPSSNTFGNVYPGSTYDTNVLFTDTDNGGNLAANVFISGSNFIYGSNNIGVSNTLWDYPSQSSYIGNALSGTPADTGITLAQPSIASPSTSNDIYFGVSIPSGTAVGFYTQTLTFNNINSGASLGSGPAAVSLTANVQGFCSISLSSTSINFGSIAASANVPTNNLITDTDSGGNVQASVLVEGTDWTGTAGTFGVSNTLYSSSSQSTYTGNALTNTLITGITGITIAAPTQSSPSTNSPIYFGLGVPAGAPAGAYSQTITIENSC
jgi:hypothetical protein